HHSLVSIDTARVDASMNTIAAITAVVVPLAAVVYAHIQLTRLARSQRELWTTRGLLIALALAFGGAMAIIYADATGLERGVIFLSAAGLTHIPSAGILFIKSRQRKGV